MEQVARFIENSKKRSELQSYAQLNVEQLQTVHLAKLKDNFTNLAGYIYIYYNSFNHGILLTFMFLFYSQVILNSQGRQLTKI